MNAESLLRYTKSKAEVTTSIYENHIFKTRFPGNSEKQVNLKQFEHLIVLNNLEFTKLGFPGFEMQDKKGNLLKAQISVNKFSTREQIPLSTFDLMSDLTILLKSEQTESIMGFFEYVNIYN